MDALVTKEVAAKTVRRHVAISTAAGIGVLGLVLLSGLPPMVVIVAALVIAGVVCGFAMHLFTEKPLVQVLAAFTIFFVLMLLWWVYVAFDNTIDGTVQGTYDVRGTTQISEEL